MKHLSFRAPLVALLLAVAPAAFAQTPGVRIGTGTGTPDASAALDVSSTSQGLLPPRLTQTQRDGIASPAAGLTIYNTTSNKLNTWNGTAWDAALSTTEQPGTLAATTFAYTGSPQTYTVPAGVYSLTVDATGAQGGYEHYAAGVGRGGKGARVQATLLVTPGEVLTLYVGGAGTSATPLPSGLNGTGYNGGGNGNAYSGGGGGASDVRRSATAPSTTLADRLLVAAGGGGSGYSAGAPSSGWGGDGGAPNGSTGGTATSGAIGGTGATQSAGGNVGGVLGRGGDSQGSAFGDNGGGGGGGYYGGGGTPNIGGGGGGSSYVTVVGSSNVVMTRGAQTGNGSITLTPGPQYAAPVLDGSNFVHVPGDNLGNHTATQNLKLGTNSLVGPGSTGLSIDNSGTVTTAGGMDVTGGNLRIASLGRALVFPDNTTQTTAAVTATGANFIQNQTGQQASSNFNISGAGTVGGLLTAGSATVSGASTLGAATIAGTTNINTSGTAATSIGTGSTAGAVTIGRSGGTVTVPKLTTAGIVTTDASGNLSSASTASFGANFIQNQTASAQTGGFNVNGAGTVGGVLTASSGAQVNGDVVVDAAGANTGIALNALRFGSSGSGEAIGSKRNATGNLNGLDFYTNFLNRLAISNGGNVGIGVTVPTQLLDVNGGILARGNNAVSYQGAYLQWNRTGGDGETWLLNQQGGGGANAGIRFGGVTTANAATEWARFLNNGNFGIGNTNPGQKLDVTGNAAISGNTTVGGTETITGNSYVNGGLGVVLNGQDRPLITRGYDAFTSGNYSGAGRWGVFMESEALAFGMPAIANKHFQWSTYNANSTIAATLMHLNQAGQLGIGTTIQTSTLDVRTADATAAITVGKTDGTAGALLFGNANHGVKRGFAGAGNDIGLFTTGGNLFLSAAGNADASQFVLLSNGNVGIGANPPTQQLDVAGGILARGSDLVSTQGAHLQWNRSGNQGETWLLNQNGGGPGGIRFGQSDAVSTGSNTVAEWARFDNNGRLGIGTTNPIAPLHVKGFAVNSLANGSSSYFCQGCGFSAVSNNSGNKNVTAYFEGGEMWVSGYIVAGNLNTTSDRRIKNIVGLSNHTADLALLNRIRITDYTYIDQVNHTPGQVVKKVIAQEVEEVLPAAVTRSTQALPNVYEKATRISFANGYLTVTTAKPHALPATGGRMRLYTPTNQELNPEVTVVDAHTVRFASTEAHAAGLFVYGKYVDDFRSVDYDAIAMLNVSATQELARKVAALEAENAAIKAHAATAEAKAAQATAATESFEARLRALESATGGQARK